jgi:hypothetical protein
MTHKTAANQARADAISKAARASSFGARERKERHAICDEVEQGLTDRGHLHHLD